MTKKQQKKWERGVLLSPWKGSLIWHGVDGGGGDDGGRGRKWSWPEDAIEIFSWWYIWPRRNLQRSRYEIGSIRQNTSDWKAELRPPGGCGFTTLARRLCLIRNASDFSLRPQAQMREALWLCHVTFSSSICEGKPKNTTKQNKTNKQTKKRARFRENKALLFFWAPSGEELDSYYIWI